MHVKKLNFNVIQQPHGIMWVLARVTFIFVLSIVISVIIIKAKTTYEDSKDTQLAVLQKSAIIKPVKVFQIGFSKCGTSSIHHFFHSNGIPSIHHGGGHLPTSIHENYINDLPLISPKYSKFLVFTDMEILYKEPQVMVGMSYFKALDKQYPGSKFILNTRNKEAWLKSRSLQKIYPSKMSLLSISSKILHLTEDKMLERWSQEMDAHHAEVIEYFKNRPSDLIVFNIEKDNPQKLVEFFKRNFRLDAKNYKKINQTSFRDIRVWYSKFFNTTPTIILSDYPPVRIMDVRAIRRQ